jgi:hypothetical protein
MENGNDLNLILSKIIKNSERKAPNHHAPEISVYDGIQVRITNDSGQSFVDTVHELEVQVFALVRIPLPGLGKFGVRVGREPNDHVRLARLHEFSFDLFPGSTKSAALTRIASRRLQPSIKLSLLSFSQFKGLILFGDGVPDFFDQDDSVRDAELLRLLG